MTTRTTDDGRATFTPGPWQTSRDAVPDWHTQVTVYAEDGERVATVFRTEANARLIAAAPELYAALDHLLDRIRIESRRPETFYAHIGPAMDEAARALARLDDGR